MKKAVMKKEEITALIILWTYGRVEQFKTEMICVHTGIPWDVNSLINFLDLGSKN